MSVIDAGNIIDASKRSNAASHGKQDQQETTIWKAAAFGELERLQACLHEDASLLNKTDDQGFFPLQWAALNNRTSLLRYLIERGAQINAVDQTGQTALHWAAVRGSTSSAEALLRAGADIRTADSRGYTVAHVAAQYGQTSLLYLLALKWEVEIDRVDNDGRSSLHWAAYKGFPDTIRLLLVLNAQVDLTDKEGCMPLHWAAIRGNGEACTVLIQGGGADLLTARDVTGSTPTKLALEKHHRYLAKYLEDAQQKEESHRSLFGRLGPLWFVTSTQLCPFIWFIIIGLVTMFVLKVVQNPTLPELGPWSILATWTCVITASLGLVLLYRITVSDPGYLPRSNGSSSAARSQAFRKQAPPAGRGSKARLTSLVTRASSEDSDRLLAYKDMDSPALWAGNWSQLCVSCKIVRPLRAKHCSVCDRCVEEFDHFCPWVGNTIGKANRFAFLVFLMVVSVAMTSSLAVAILRMHQLTVRHRHNIKGVHGTGWAAAFIFFDGFVLLGVAALMLTQASQISRNITTNELANWPRYKYLRSSDGAFRNPFDQGLRENCIEIAFPEKAASAPIVLVEDDVEIGRSLLRN